MRLCKEENKENVTGIAIQITIQNHTTDRNNNTITNYSTETYINIQFHPHLGTLKHNQKLTKT